MTTKKTQKEFNQELENRNRELSQKLDKAIKYRDLLWEELKETKIKLQSANEKIEELESESPSQQLIENLQNQLKNENLDLDSLLAEISRLINELIDSSKKLEEAKTEKVELLKDVFVEGKTGDKNLVELEKKLRNKNEKIKVLDKEVKDSMSKLDVEYDKLTLKIKNKKSELEEKKKRILDIKEDDPSAAEEITEKVVGKGKASKIIGKGVSLFVRQQEQNEISEDELKRLLEVQIRMTKHNDPFMSEIKDNLLSELSANFNSGELKSKSKKHLKELCEKQREITELEMQLENAKMISKIIDMKQDKMEENKNSDIILAPDMPFELFKKIKKKGKIKDDYDFGEINYKEILFHEQPFAEQKQKQLLPTRLYNIRKHQKGGVIVDDLKVAVEESKERNDIKRYTILSYVCGPYECCRSVNCEHKKKCKKHDKNCREHIYKGLKKSLFKVIEACHYLNSNHGLKIDYLWVDQLCIDQSDEKDEDNKSDKDREIPKMHQYYTNAYIALVAIQGELSDKKNSLPHILSRIVRSEWFTRCWTYQEGWLSRQTIFMFDDVLVDGRAIAASWVLCQPSYNGSAKFSVFTEFIKSDKKFATPLGCTYSNKDREFEESVYLRLDQALRATKDRDKTVAIDGIYSVLGLLPYGEKVKIKYKKWGQSYTKEELSGALLDVMKVATENDHGEELLAWHGETSKLCWMPEINDKNSSLNFLDKLGKFGLKSNSIPILKKGSVDIKGGINVEFKGKKNFLGFGGGRNILTVNDNIKLIGTKYSIVLPSKKNIIKVEKGSLIEGGVYMRKIYVKKLPESNYKENLEISLLGTHETLEKIEEGDFILVPNKKEWDNHNNPFALIFSRKSGTDVYNRKGLVELLKWELEKLDQNGTENVEIAKAENIFSFYQIEQNK